jgi:hypothetical protein
MLSLKIPIENGGANHQVFYYRVPDGVSYSNVVCNFKESKIRIEMTSCDIFI